MLVRHQFLDTMLVLLVAGAAFIPPALAQTTTSAIMTTTTSPGVNCSGYNGDLIGCRSNEECGMDASGGDSTCYECTSLGDQSSCENSCCYWSGTACGNGLCSATTTFGTSTTLSTVDCSNYDGDPTGCWTNEECGMNVFGSDPACYECTELTNQDVCQNSCCYWNGTACGNAVCNMTGTIGVFETTTTTTASDTAPRAKAKKKAKKRLGPGLVMVIAVGSAAMASIAIVCIINKYV